MTVPAHASSPARRPQPFGYVLGVLFSLYLLNYLDRQIVNILAEPIKRELGLSDAQLGAMTGLAFALFYTVLGIPLARYADKATTDRPRLMAVSVIAWSGMTALCGMATSFLQMLLFRIGVGIGEAGCSPAAHSLISDLAPKEKRARALSIYALGIPLGKLLGMMIGGLVAQALGWRIAFLTVGLPGIILGALTWLTLRDPRRDAPADFKPPPQPPLAAVMADLLPNSTLWWISLGGSFMSFISYGQTAFMGSFFIRVHGLSVGEAGVLLGVAFGLAGAVGTIVGGQLTDRLATRWPKGYVLVPAIAAVFGAGLFALAMAAESTGLALCLLACASALNSTWYGPIFATVQGIVKPAQRATAAAAHLFILALIGLGLGPLLFGMVSDWLNAQGHGQADGLRYALIAASVPAGLISVACFLVAARSIERHLAAADQAS